MLCDIFTNKGHKSAWKTGTCTYHQQWIHWKLRSAFSARTSAEECYGHSSFWKLFYENKNPLIFLEESLVLFKHSPEVLSPSGQAENFVLNFLLQSHTLSSASRSSRPNWRTSNFPMNLVLVVCAYHWHNYADFFKLTHVIVIDQNVAKHLFAYLIS